MDASKKFHFISTAVPTLVGGIIRHGTLQSQLALSAALSASHHPAVSVEMSTLNSQDGMPKCNPMVHYIRDSGEDESTNTVSRYLA